MIGSILIFLQNLAGGGAERVALLLANGFAGLGHKVTLVLVRREGPFLDLVSPEVELVALRNARTAASAFELAGIIRQKKPDVVISHLTHVNVSAVVAGLISGYARRTIVVEHNQFDKNYRLLTSRSVKLAYRATRFVYPLAGAMVSVSKGVEEVMERVAKVHHRHSYVIYNPIVHQGIFDRAAETPEHPWLAADRAEPVLLAVDSLSKQKDFPTFIRAVAALNRRRSVKAIICGEGPERPALEALIKELGLEDRISLPGFAKNPFSFMRSCDLYVMSSQWEGLPTVLVEALACGATIVSTDCLSGPREILLDGKLGYLARVNDPDDLAAKMESGLANPVAKSLLAERAADFSVPRALDNYAAVFDQIAGTKTGLRSVKRTTV